MKKRQILAKAVLAVVLTGVLGLTAACGQSADSTQSKETETTAAAASAEETDTASELPDEIRLGYWESPNEELLVKQSKALEEAYPDVKITWVQFEAGTDILTAMQGGSIDIATIGTPPGTLGIANGIPYKIFYLHDIIDESEGLIIKNSTGITDISDIKGTTIATTFGSTSHFSLLNALEQNGISESDVTILDMKPADIYAAWERGDIDGAYIWESTKTQLLESDGTELISSGDVAAKGALTGEFGIVHNDFYEAYPDVIKTYIDLLDQASDSYKNDQENTASLISSGLGLSQEETLKAMNEIIVLSKEDQKSEEYIGTTDQPGQLAQILKNTSDFLVSQGSIKEETDIAVFEAAILTELYD
ncbi:MAG: ABC transporter substrate-binding protein [Lachnospiraceae bacterium]